MAEDIKIAENLTEENPSVTHMREYIRSLETILKSLGHTI